MEHHARVVTSDGQVHDTEQTKYAVVGRKFDIEAPVMYAHDQDSLSRATSWFKENHPELEYRVFSQKVIANT